MKKIIALSVMFVLSIGLYTATQTKAANANTNVTLAITSGTLSCTAPTSIDLGSYTAQVASHTESGSTWVGSLFECTDLKGNASRDIQVIGSGASGLVAGAYNIARTGVTLNAGTPVLVNGTCTYSSAGGTMDASRNILRKTAAAGQTCKVNLPNSGAGSSRVDVVIGTSQAVGSYAGVLTVTLPS